MTRDQASKRKRKGYMIFRAFNLATLCRKCGAKIPNHSRHHWLCNKCWKINQKKKLERLENEILPRPEGRSI